MRQVYQPRMLANLLHICRRSNKTVIYNLTALLEMHTSVIKTKKHLKMACSLTRALTNVCTETVTDSHIANISCVAPGIKQHEMENEDNIHSVEPHAVEAYEDVSYYVENGLRKVYPYYFTYRTFVKERWVGQKLLDVLQNEFRIASAEEYMWRFQSGAVTVNNEKVDMDYRLKHNDYIRNTIHRHEGPVIYEPVHIIHLDKDILVINKPASVPVHPCGEYRCNSLLFILAKEYKLKNVRPVHRLDRLASGLLIYGRTREMAQTLAHQIRNREVQKEYICRVAGEFPDKVIECGEPIEAVDCKISVGKVSANGKPSLTVFQKLSYNGKSSVLLCKPTTGRMHQIRIHLQFLGYPILNDYLYNGSQTIAQILENDLAEVSSSVESFRNHQDKQSVLNVTENDFSQPVSSTSSQFDKLCLNCSCPAPDPRFSDIMIYLHAWKYQGKGWSYKTKLPDWALENWSCD